MHGTVCLTDEHYRYRFIIDYGEYED